MERINHINTNKKARFDFGDDKSPKKIKLAEQEQASGAKVKIGQTSSELFKQASELAARKEQPTIAPLPTSTKEIIESIKTSGLASMFYNIEYYCDTNIDRNKFIQFYSDDSIKKQINIEDKFFDLEEKDVTGSCFFSTAIDSERSGSQIPLISTITQIFQMQYYKEKYGIDIYLFNAHDSNGVILNFEIQAKKIISILECQNSIGVLMPASSKDDAHDGHVIPIIINKESNDGICIYTMDSISYLDEIDYDDYLEDGYEVELFPYALCDALQRVVGQENVDIERISGVRQFDEFGCRTDALVCLKDVLLAGPSIALLNEKGEAVPAPSFAKLAQLPSFLRSNSDLLTQPAHPKKPMPVAEHRQKHEVKETRTRTVSLQSGEELKEAQLLLLRRHFKHAEVKISPENPTEAIVTDTVTKNYFLRAKSIAMANRAINTASGLDQSLDDYFTQLWQRHVI